MKKYLGMYILRPDLEEEQVTATIEKLNKIFTDNGGEILSVEKWGVRQLAYPIQDFDKGFYVKFFVNAENKGVAEYTRICNIDEGVMRHILVKD